MQQIYTDIEDLKTHIIYELELEELTQELINANSNLFMIAGISQELFLQECEEEIKDVYRDVKSLESRMNELIKDYSFKRIMKSISSQLHQPSSDALTRDMISSFAPSFYEHCIFFEKRRISKSEFLRDYLKDFLSDEYIQSIFAVSIENSMSIMYTHGGMHPGEYLDKITRCLADYYFAKNKEEAKVLLDTTVADTKDFVGITSPFTEHFRKKLFLMERGCPLFVPDKWAEVRKDAEAIKEGQAEKDEKEKQLDAMWFPWERRTALGEKLGKHTVKKAQEICEKYILIGNDETEEKIAALLYISTLNYLKEARKNNKKERGMFWASAKSIATSTIQIDRIISQFGSRKIEIDDDWLTLNFLECISRDLYDFNKTIRKVDSVEEDGWSSVTTNLFDFELIFDLVLSDVSCRESYHWIKEMHEIHDLKLVGFTKKELYHAQILTAVLLNIDKPHIKSAIEDIIIEMDGVKCISNEIEERIQYESVHFVACDIGNNTNPSQSLMHNSAVNFLVFYLHNPMYLLPISAYPSLYFADLSAGLFAEVKSPNISDIIEETYDISKMSEEEKKDILDKVDDTEDATLMVNVIELVQTVETVLTKLYEEKLNIKDRNHPFTIISYAKGEYKNWNRIFERFLNPDFIIQVASVIWLDGLFGQNNNWIETFLKKSDEAKTNYIIQRAHDIFLFNEMDELGELISDADLNIFEDMDSANLEEKLFEMEQKLKEQTTSSESAVNNKEQYKELIQPLKNQIKELTNNYSALHSQNKKLLETIEEERREKEKLKEDQQELIKLRELLFDLGKSEVEIETKDISSELMSILRDKKIVIIGGHDKMLLELKQKYDSITSFTKETANIAPVIRNADHVFICYEWINHSLYYKAMDVIKTCGVEMDYIKGMNTKKAEEFIFSKLSHE